MSALKYLSFLIIPTSVYFSFLGTGIQSFSALAVAFVLIPAIELVFTPKHPVTRDLSPKDSILFDLLLVLAAVIHFGLLAYFIYHVSSQSLALVDLIGHTTAMGLMCGVFGINLAHELGHRRSRGSRTLAKALLATSLYMHFYIEHNKGHHKNVATPDDPASARYSETLYTFWIRSIAFSYLSAWRIQLKELKRARSSFLSKKNEMLLYHLIQVTFMVLLAVFVGPKTLLCFIGAALIGILLLETVNYIEHYGLSRSKISEKRYQNVEVYHSWNSDHPIGRLVLFELSRHSDHHHNPHKKYQNLESHEEAPHLPTGYPGMMVLSLIPPIWFHLMNPRIP